MAANECEAKRKKKVRERQESNIKQWTVNGMKGSKNKCSVKGRARRCLVEARELGKSERVSQFKLSRLSFMDE